MNKWQIIIYCLLQEKWSKNIQKISIQAFGDEKWMMSEQMCISNKIDILFNAIEIISIL